jgi:hypothetical protein
MKITVGQFEVGVDIEPLEGESDVLLFTASCGQTKRQGRVHIQGAHDSKEEQHSKDVEAFANRLAVEAAGMERTREFTQKFKKEQPA